MRLSINRWYFAQITTSLDTDITARPAKTFEDEGDDEYEDC
jgi:hypothetical protein